MPIQVALSRKETLLSIWMTTCLSSLSMGCLFHNASSVIKRVSWDFKMRKLTLTPLKALCLTAYGLTSNWKNLTPSASYQEFVLITKAGFHTNCKQQLAREASDSFWFKRTNLKLYWLSRIRGTRTRYGWPQEHLRCTPKFYYTCNLLSFSLKTNQSVRNLTNW